MRNAHVMPTRRRICVGTADAARVPDPAVVRDLWLRNRGLDDLRRTLLDATGDARFAREFDLLDQLRYHWHAEQKARDRVFTHMLSPGHRPK